jgi:hypothetical protein
MNRHGDGHTQQLEDYYSSMNVTESRVLVHSEVNDNCEHCKLQAAPYDDDAPTREKVI